MRGHPDARRARPGRPTTHLSRLAAVAALLGVAVPALAAGNLSDLGKPTDDVPGIGEKLDGFVPITSVHRNQRKVTVYVFDSLWDGGSAEMRWPVVKALDRFGTWSGLAATQSPRYVAPRPPSYWIFPAVPTFDWSHARYRSPYVTFVHHVVQARRNGPVARLPGPEEALFQRATHLSAPSYQEADPNHMDRYPLPGVVVGSYARQGPFEDPDLVVLNGGHAGVSPGQPNYTFANLQHVMRLGHGEYWLQEFNAYANTVVALICAQDGFRPAAVCRRPSLHYILTQKH